VDKQGLGKNLYFHSATLSAQNNASPTVVLDSGSIVTPSYAYNAYLLAFIMYKPSSDGHNYFKATDGTTTTSRVQNANGSSTRHSVFGMAGKWMAGGTMIAFQGNSASNGRVFITFTEAFPNGIVSAVALRDGTATAVSQISIENDQIDKTKLCFVVANSAGTVQTSTAVAFSWLAVGF
jgi:hypothetical protein